MFAALMDTVETDSLGQIIHARYDAGGGYRRDAQTLVSHPFDQMARTAATIPRRSADA